MKNFKRLMGIVLVAAMAVSMFAGCGKSSTDGQYNTSEDRTLGYWTGNSISGYVSDYNETVALQKVQELADIEVDFIHPSSAAWEEQFNIMIASQDYPQIVHYNWGTRYEGGYEGAYSDGLILDLTPYADKLPNYMNLMKEHPDVDKTLRTTEGKMLYFGVVSNDVITNSNLGPMIRQDWLDKLGLKMPTTMDEWYTVLKAFKTQDPNGNGIADEIPFAEYRSAAFKFFASAYGTKQGDIFVKNGKVVYGSIQPEFKEYLAEMSKWYTEGLIDPEYAALEKATIDAYMTNDTSGACIAYVGGSMGNYLAAKKDDPNYDLVAAPWPSKAAGAPAYIGIQLERKAGTDVGSVITTNTKNLDVALEFMDTLYSKEATDFLNWGVEGHTYTKNADGSYAFTDFVLNNPDGLSAVQALTPIAFPAYGIPARITDGEAYSQMQYAKPQQKDASIKWSTGDRSLMTQLWPLTADESLRISEIKASLATYESEMITKIVMGKEPVSKFDSFVSELKARGIDEMVNIYQGAYDRYMAQ